MTDFERTTEPADLTNAQLQRLVYSLWDFQQALSALTFLTEDCDFKAKYTAIQMRRFRCFETNAIVSFARPFVSSRNHSTLGLRAIGVRLTQHEQLTKKKLLALRQKVIAHSDEEEMHFRGTTFQPFEDVPIEFPHFVFQEALYLAEEDFAPFEALLHKLVRGISSVIFQVAQVTPERLNRYKLPGRMYE